MAAKVANHEGLYDADCKDLRAYIKSLRRYARALVGDSSDADDLVQETLKRALTYCDGTKEIRNLRAYLMTMLHNVRADMVKQQIRAGDPVELDKGPQLAVLPIQNDRIACNEVAEAIERLPEEQREVLLLVGLENLTYQGAADILDVPIGTVMSRLNRGRIALRHMLGMDPGVAAKSPVQNRRPGPPMIQARHAGRTAFRPHGPQGIRPSGSRA